MASLRLLAEDGPVLGEIVVESWVEVSEQPTSPTAERPTHLPHGPDDYLRLLREAQRDSNQSSALVSLASTRKNSPHSSPKSPPNSPNTEPAGEGEELKGFYINYCTKDGTSLENDTDWVWDWSSRPESQAPKEWKFMHPEGRIPIKKPYGYSIRFAKVGGTSVFSRQVLYTMVITNLVTLLLGTGIGFWLSRRSNDVLQLNLD
jgi:BCL2/adenovirus E1B protein-interacting protein 3|uniref:BCL2/adenovirus E1B 19 kDa protein-interacting protein 3 n=1 Tax=Daphnia galeata TaxID=27404 RepID=A0A8J2WNU0_9CRUS|nr:unnamed protein product [Daphnia galeata]